MLPEGKLELLAAQNTGVAEILAGGIASEGHSIELASTSVTRVPSAKAPFVESTARRYRLDDSEKEGVALVTEFDMDSKAGHLTSRLIRRGD